MSWFIELSHELQAREPEKAQFLDESHRPSISLKHLSQERAEAGLTKSV